MKIYYLSFSKIPSRDANSVHVMHMCNSFSKNGHNVTLFAKKGHKSNIHFFDYYDVSKSFKVIRSLFPQIKLLGDIIYGLETLRKLLFLPNPDLYYGRHPHLMFFMSFKNTPLIYEVHDIPKSLIQKYIEVNIIKSKHFKKLIVISESLKKEYIKIFPWLNSKHIIVAHDGASIPLTQTPIIKLKRRQKTLQVGYTGNLYPGRGIELILRLAKYFPAIDFQIIGGSDEDIKKWANVNKPQNIHFYGYIPHNKIHGCLTSLDILLAPYQTKVTIGGGKGDISRWMSPLKIFEYMSAEKPIISSNLPVLQEVLKDRHNAILCPPDDFHAWVKAINLLNENPSLQKTLGQNAKKDLINKYTWNTRAKTVLTI